METSLETKEVAPLNPYFEVWTAGHFKETQVQVKTIQPSEKPTDLVRLIEENWEKQNRERIAKGQKPMNNQPQLLIQNIRVRNGSLELEVAPSSFKDFMGTRSTDVRDRFPRKFLADIVGTNVLIKTVDDKLMVVQRSLEAATKPGAMSVVGGYPDPQKDTNPDGNWNPFKTVTRELEEEAVVKKEELRGLELLGVIYNQAAQNPAVIFIAESSISSDQIKMRKGEEVLVKFIPDEKREIEKAILWWAFSPSPSWASALALHGREKFGQDWFEYINQRLTYRFSRLYSKLTSEQEKKLERRAAAKLSKL